MSLHRREHHEEALAALLTADDAAGRTRVAFEASPLARCAECRGRYEQHAELAQRLDALGRLEEDDLAATLAAPPVEPGPAEEALRQRLASGARPARARRAPWGWIAAAVAAGLALVLWLRRVERPREPGPILGSGIVTVHPVGEVDSFAPFTWEHAGSGAGWYRVIVMPAGSETTPTDSGALRTTSWNPEPAVMAAWGDEIRYRVEVYGGAGGSSFLDSVGAWAKLSSR